LSIDYITQATHFSISLLAETLASITSFHIRTEQQVLQFKDTIASNEDGCNRPSI
jgi:hypothetical protein